MESALITRHTFSAQHLIDTYPPRLKNSNKKLIHQTCSPEGAIHNGDLTFSRWRAMPFPSPPDLTHPTVVEARPDFFTYDVSPHNEWHLNFAHHDLFCAYGGPLFAQDEIQVAEHPALASLREALLAQRIVPLTVENGNPTPILIHGVERRCAIATNPDPAAGRPEGIYGNRFARASPDAIRQATHILDPPTLTHILAMEAPYGSHGKYSRREIEYILTTAYTGFAAVRHESGSHPAIVHTGFWGCGVYGGNRVLMILLQRIAATMAMLDRLIVHTGDTAGLAAVSAAQERWETLTSTNDINTFLAQIQAMEFRWGISDGN